MFHNAAYALYSPLPSDKAAPRRRAMRYWRKMLCSRSWAGSFGSGTSGAKPVSAQCRTASSLAEIRR
jgi:hypothetical protein